MDSTPPATTTSAPPGHDALGSLSNRLQSGRAEAVDGDGGNLHRQSRAQGGDTGDVHALFGFGHGATEDDVLDLFGIELGYSLEGALDRVGGEVIRTGGAQGSFVGFADRGTNGTYDYDFTHEKLRSSYELVNSIATALLIG